MNETIELIFHAADELHALGVYRARLGGQWVFISVSKTHQPAGQIPNFPKQFASLRAFKKFQVSPDWDDSFSSLMGDLGETTTWNWVLANPSFIHADYCAQIQTVVEDFLDLVFEKWEETLGGEKSSEEAAVVGNTL